MNRAKPKRRSSAAARASAETELQLAFALFNEINIIAQLSANLMERALPHGLTLSQFSVLNWFVRVDDLATPGRLSRAFQVSKGAMTNTLARLVEKKFVTVVGDPDSGRRKLVRITPVGRQARALAIESLFPELERFLTEFGPAAVRTQLPALQRIRRYLDELRAEPPDADAT